MSRRTTSRRTTSRRTTPSDRTPSNRTLLRNTQAQIETVGEMDLVPGKTYLIQHNREGIGRGENRINIWRDITQEQANAFITRFRGKFIRIVGGDSIVHEEAHTLPVFPISWNIALFENLELVNSNKVHLPAEINIITPIPNTDKFTRKTVSDFMDNDDGPLLPYAVAEENFLTELRNNNTIVGFPAREWSFAESSSEVQKEIVQKTLGHLAYDRPNPKDSYEQRRLANLQGKVFNERGTGTEIAGYLGTRVPPPTEQQREQMENELNTLTITGSKRKHDEVEGGRKRRTRRGKSRKGRTRKGKSRKGKTMKRRHHYKK